MPESDLCTLHTDLGKQKTDLFKAIGKVESLQSRIRSLEKTTPENRT